MDRKGILDLLRKSERGTRCFTSPTGAMKMRIKIPHSNDVLYQMGTLCGHQYDFYSDKKVSFRGEKRELIGG